MKVGVYGNQNIYKEILDGKYRETVPEKDKTDIKDWSCKIKGSTRAERSYADIYNTYEQLKNSGTTDLDTWNKKNNKPYTVRKIVTNPDGTKMLLILRVCNGESKVIRKMKISEKEHNTDLSQNSSEVSFDAEESDSLQEFEQE